MIIRVLSLFFLASLAWGQDTAREAAKRIAFVVSNSHYRKLPVLPSAIAEGSLMADALNKAGFAVQELPDATGDDIRRMDKALETAVNTGDVVLLYFSGYAVHDDGGNYLVPVDFNPAGAGELSDRVYSLTRFAQTLEERGAGLKILIVEGCRKLDGVPGVTGPGLREPALKGLTESLFAFAASEGKTSSDGPDQVAAFTKFLAARISAAGSRLKEVFDGASADVLTDSQRSQIPQKWENVILNVDFYFIAPEVKPPDRFLTVRQNQKDREEYVLLPNGRFMMGCVPGDKRCNKDEIPRHSVTITKPFWMGRNEVQIESWQRYTESQKIKPRLPKEKPRWIQGWNITTRPIVFVSVDDARGYCAWAGGRLPSEAEWEYAARGGKEGEIYPMSLEEAREKANFAGMKLYDQEAAPVRKFDPGPWKLFDMAGNVWEMVNDYYSRTYYATRPSVDRDPTGPAEGKSTVSRGGSYFSGAEEHLRTSIRREFGKPDNETGFRCVLEDSPKTEKFLQ